MGKEFNLNIGASEDAGKGKGSSGFGFKHTINMQKAFGKHLTGTDVMSDGYYNQVNKVEDIEGGGSGINMNAGPTYLTDPEEDKNKPANIDPSNELLRDKDQNIIPDDAKVSEIDVSMGRGGKGKGKQTTRTIRRVKGDDKPNADRYGVGRIGTEKTFEYGDLKKTKTELGGAKGFVKSGPKKGMVIEDEVNKIKPRGIQKLS
jgi:hypothetical protein